MVATRNCSISRRRRIASRLSLNKPDMQVILSRVQGLPPLTGFEVSPIPFPPLAASGGTRRKNLHMALVNLHCGSYVPVTTSVTLKICGLLCKAFPLLSLADSVICPL